MRRRGIVFYSKGRPFYRSAIFFVFVALAFLPPLFFIKRADMLLQVLNYSLISIVTVAFEFGYGAAYFISIGLGFIVLISALFNRGFEVPCLTSIVFLNLVALIPGYYNRTYNSYFSSKDSLFKRTRSSFDQLTSDLKTLKDLNISLQNQVHDILDLYEVTKKMSASMEMVEMLRIFKNAVNKISKFKKADVVLISGEQECPGALITYEILNFLPMKSRSVDIQTRQPSQFDKILAETVCARKEIIYLNHPIDQSHPFKPYLKESNESFLALPLLSEDIPIGIWMISGVEEEQVENFSILAEQLALEVKKINLYEKVQALAITDGLTGIYVRRHFLERLNEEVARAKRHNLKLSLLMIDLDHFKRCNDTYGHLVGDIVLKDTARIMKEYIRQVDLIGRYGGEEFIIALPDTDKSAAIHVAERIRQSLEKHSFKAYDETISSTISIGIATYPDNGADVATLIDRADQALYKAKEEGRNKVVSL